MVLGLKSRTPSPGICLRHQLGQGHRIVNVHYQEKEANMRILLFNTKTFELARTALNIAQLFCSFIHGHKSYNHVSYHHKQEQQLLLAIFVIHHTIARLTSAPRPFSWTHCWNGTPVTLNVHKAIFHSFYSWNHNLVFVQKSNNRISMHGLKSILEKERLSRHLSYRINSSDPEISRRVSLQIYQWNLCRRRMND